MEYIVDDKNWTHLPLLCSSNKYGKAIMILKNTVCIVSDNQYYCL